MRTSRQLNAGAGAALLALAAALTLLVGLQREVARRYPVSDLPRVNRARIEEQVRGGNLNRTEALFSRVPNARSDTAQNR